MKHIEDIADRLEVVVQEIERLKPTLEGKSRDDMNIVDVGQFAFVAGMLYAFGWVVETEVDVTPIIQAVGLENLFDRKDTGEDIREKE